MVLLLVSLRENTPDLLHNVELQPGSPQDLLCRLGELVVKSKNAVGVTRAAELLDPADTCRPSKREENEARVVTTYCEKEGQRWLSDAQRLGLSYPSHVVTILGLIIPSDPTVDARFNSHQLWSSVKSDDVSSALLGKVLTGRSANLLEVALLHSDKHSDRCVKLCELFQSVQPSIEVALPDNITEQNPL